MNDVKVRENRKTISTSKREDSNASKIRLMSCEDRR